MATNVYYSVSPFGTGNLLTGGSPTISVDGSGNATLVLNGATQVDNIGIGVAVSYNGITSYISSITSATSFSLVTAIGVQVPTQSSTSVISINHEYASLSAFEAGYTDANHINNSSLISADVAAFAFCYHDHDDETVDTILCSVGGVTMDATRNLSIVAPIGGTESIRNQRSTSGLFEANTYRRITTSSDNIRIFGGYTDWHGIYCKTINAVSNVGVFISTVGSSSAITNLHDCVLDGDGSSFTYNYFSGDNQTVNITNTVICGTKRAFFGGIRHDSGIINLLNVTSYNNYYGLRASAGTATAKNCVFFSNTDDWEGTITSENCASDDNNNGGTGDFQITQTANNYADLVTDAINCDFSLTDSSSELYNAGTNTGAPATDIIGTIRPQDTTVDIGAFELIVGGGLTVLNNGILPAMKGELTLVTKLKQLNNGSMPPMTGALTRKVSYRRGVSGEI